MAHVVAAIQHAVSVAGIEHVALGSDFDGTVTTPFDTSHMAAVTHALLEVSAVVSTPRRCVHACCMAILSHVGVVTDSGGHVEGGRHCSCERERAARHACVPAQRRVDQACETHEHNRNNLHV